MITADQVLKAGHLLSRRMQHVSELEKIRSSDVTVIEFTTTYFAIDSEMTKHLEPVKDLIARAIEKAIAEIDTQLRALGVEPPLSPSPAAGSAPAESPGTTKEAARS